MLRVDAEQADVQDADEVIQRSIFMSGCPCYFMANANNEGPTVVM